MLDDLIGPTGMLRSRVPVLRLRQEGKEERPKVRQYSDGPWIRHLDEIGEHITLKDELPANISRAEYRTLKEQKTEELAKAVRDGRCSFKELLSVVSMARPIVMSEMEGMDDDDIALAVERYFVNTHIYLQPGAVMSLGTRERSSRDWSWNARGVYYRHFYSPEWVTGDHSLWIPTLGNLDWDSPTEESRRERARKFLRHTQDNESWNKSEYVWEADAWTDVFGQMRDDPVLASNKHEYYAERTEVHPMSCLQTGKSKFIKRIPDATFGLATFKPRHYQNAIACYDLDAARIEALMLHRHCGLISDPRWGDANLIYPFAVYEAKGWNGDPREARHQACAAGMTYLDMLDTLTRHPGLSGKIDGAYQTPESRSTQVFAMTSFGAHWHIMVGYRRPRLAREHAGRPGLSDTVYVFQRIWSGRVVTERKAWELLSIIDQVHLWGVTDFRDFVIQHLKPWHEFCKKCYVADVDAIYDTINDHPERAGMVPQLPLPDWTKKFADANLAKFRQRADELLCEAVQMYQPSNRRKEDSFPRMMMCLKEDCGRFRGYPLSSQEEAMKHYTEVHGDVINENFREVLEKMFCDEDGDTESRGEDRPASTYLKRHAGSDGGEEGQRMCKKARV